MMLSIFDLGDDRYTAQVVPESFKKVRQPRISNWSTEDREAYCGIYTARRRNELAPWNNDPTAFEYLKLGLQADFVLVDEAPR